MFKVHTSIISCNKGKVLVLIAELEASSWSLGVC